MRFTEIQTTKPVKPKPPLTPAQARVDSLKKRVERDRDALSVEREAQRRTRDMEQRFKSQLQATKAARLGQ